MLRPRIIPCLLIKNRGVVKTINFKDHVYIGDPINTARIFSEKRADELMILDIDATSKNQDPDYQMIKNIANQCRMPLCYGGGIKTVEQALRILSLGVEKIAFSSLFIENPDVLTNVAKVVGNQSIIVVLDIKKDEDGKYVLYTNNAKKKTPRDIETYLKQLSELEVGEVVINSIDRDGTMSGYDIELVKFIRTYISVPITVMGGAGTIEHLKNLVGAFGVIGIGVGSMFVFKGVHKAVLINYPDDKQKVTLCY